MIKIHNTLTRVKEDFVPIEGSKVKMYICGPTVYDVPHIGHARSAYIFDFIRRYMEYSGYEVLFVRNVTDIDDKIINKAASELEEMFDDVSGSKLKARVREVSERYLDIYHRELDLLGIRPPVLEPRATEQISEMIVFIERLIEKGVAYEAGESVYFSVERFENYGKLSHRDPEQMLHAVRIDEDSNKKDPLDFVLWKSSKENEPSWDSPWGGGRPGWHIECSVMSTGLLGDNFDIHGGGLDLVFPHHENEIAQAEACTGKPFANYWMHNGLLSVAGEKMSKSLGNYITISDFLEKFKDPDLIKLAFLNSHYRSPMDYSDAKLEESRKAKERILIFFDKADRLVRQEDDKRSSGDHPGAAALGKVQSAINGLREKFDDAMNDDFNSPLALAVIFEAVRLGNDYVSDPELLSGDKASMVKAVRNLIQRLAETFGLSLRPVKADSEEETRINNLIILREEAREKKDFATSDKIRADLAEKGVVIEDTPEGTIWRKK